MVLDSPDELLEYTACGELDAIGAVRALLEVLCDIEMLATRALAAIGRRIGDSSTLEKGRSTEEQGD